MEYVQSAGKVLVDVIGYSQKAAMRRMARCRSLPLTTERLSSMRLRNGSSMSRKRKYLSAICRFGKVELGANGAR
jgi:hypothetical protein